ncbi:MAG: FeoB-associated Cys-rich membrane protein [Ruminococcus sp.]|nr:FeoB-associated Cys-rich membrane protein [Ruminococcus sp.]MBR5683594.1 FeoB-associated Cys-rich membrane protein [Ruminococcus sp.]
MNVFDIVILLCIAAGLVLAVRSLIKQKKKGSCCGDCSTCRRRHRTKS